MSFCIRRSAIVVTCFALQGAGFAYTSASDSYVATWKDNARAAYSLTADDCHPSEVYTIAPALTERGLHGTFYVNPGPANWGWYNFKDVGDINGDGKPDGWAHLPEQGHELGGHTLYHYSVVQGFANPGNPTGTFPSLDALNADLVQTNSIIQDLTGQKVVSFAYPYGYYDAPSEAVVMQNYLSARSLWYQRPVPEYVPNPATPPDMGALYCFYVEGVQPWCDFTNYTQASTNFAKMLSSAVAARGWGIEFFHQTGDDISNSNYYGDFSNIDRNAYYEHLDNIVGKVQSGIVWEDTVGNVTRYIDSRKAARITYDSNSSAAIQLRVDDNLDHSLFNEPLTINTVIPTEWGASLSITENGRPVAFTTFVDSGSGATYASYDVIADGSAIVLSHRAAIQAIHTFPPGDYNEDGFVDAADYTIWADSLGSSSNLAADGDGDGIIGHGDHDVWVSHFGRTGAGSASAALRGSPVSEPSTMLLSGTVVLLIAAPYRYLSTRPLDAR